MLSISGLAGRPARFAAGRRRVLLAFRFPQATTEVPIYMMRRLSIIAAAAGAAAMLGLGALPASAAPMKATTHNISFPGMHGLVAWGNYTKSGSKVHVNVCVGDTVRGIFATGAVTLESNANNSHHSELGAVDIGYHEAVCRSETLRYTNHLRVYTFIANGSGRITKTSKIKTIY